MNSTIDLIHNRRSVRAYENREISDAVKDVILEAALRAPTAGNMMLYSIIEVSDREKKETLVKTCDNQPFIARAPLVLLFLADYQRWFDYFIASGVEKICEQKGSSLRTPEEGDLFIACCDALIAAQTAVLAAESMGVGSCYIGDIMENYETHRELFDLPDYVFPIALICFGYPTKQQEQRKLTPRYAKEYIVCKNRYRRLEKKDFAEMYREMHEWLFSEQGKTDDPFLLGRLMYERKYDTDFCREMSRSVRAMLRSWTNHN